MSGHLISITFLVDTHFLLSFFIWLLLPKQFPRTNRNEFHLDDKEQYILDEKFKLSGMKSKSAFIRKLILYGYVYDVDYSFLREYNTELGRISSNLNQIAKRINSTNHVYQEDMDEVKELMKQVWQSQKSMLSQQPLIKR